jgi:hypothetical protein
MSNIVDLEIHSLNSVQASSDFRDYPSHPTSFIIVKLDLDFGMLCDRTPHGKA